MEKKSIVCVGRSFVELKKSTIHDAYICCNESQKTCELAIKWREYGVILKEVQHKIL